MRYQRDLPGCVVFLPFLIVVLFFLGWFAFYGTVGYVLFHFISKLW